MGGREKRKGGGGERDRDRDLLDSSEERQFENPGKQLKILL